MNLAGGGLAVYEQAVYEQGPVQHRRQQPGRLPGVADGGAPLGLVTAGGEDHRVTGIDPRGREAGDRLHNLLELEQLNRADVPNGSWDPWGVRPTGLAAILV